MRQSSLFGATQKQEPRDVHSRAHRLLLKGGYVKPVSSGLFAFMPRLARVLDNLSDLVQSELDSLGFEPCALPLLRPKAALEQARPWTRQPGEPLEARDRRGTALGLGAGHEPLFAELIRGEVSSARQLPKRVRLSTPVFPQEAGSRKGLLRLHESRSIQALSCEADPTNAEGTVRAVREALVKLCTQLDLEAGWVWAMSTLQPALSDQALAVWADQGETQVLACDRCSYAATLDRAESRLETFPQEEAPQALEAIHGPGLIGVGPLAEFLNLPVWKTTKTLLMQADDRVVAVMVRGDCDVSEAKVRQHLQCSDLRLASAGVIKDLTGADVGYAGPIDLPGHVQVLADEATRDRVNFECGANRTDYHLINVNFGRDLDWPVFGDFKQAEPGHFCPSCPQGRLKGKSACIIAWSAILSPLFAETFKCLLQTQDQGPQPMVFTSSGLDLGALTAAVAELHCDGSGIIWPRRIAPFQVHLVGLNLEKDDLHTQAEKLYQDLLSAGLSVLFDDRHVRAGEKFGDADLLGVPLRVTLSSRTLAEGQVELKLRNRDEAERLALDEAVQALQSRADGRGLRVDG